MKPRTAVSLAAASAVATAVAMVAAQRAWSDPVMKARAERWWRVGRLTTFRGGTFVVTKVRGTAANEERRRQLDERFAIRTAEDVTAQLGHMKGALMKIGQLVSFIAEGLPDNVQETLASLQADVPPMSPSLAESVISEDLGASPDRLFLHWDPLPVAAASIGQVHKAVLRDGREVAVKVQYPGLAATLDSDLADAKRLHRLFSMVALKSLDMTTMVNELRERMHEELDYELEASRQQRFHERYLGHPFLAVPAVHPEFSSRRVLTSDWVDGMDWATFEASADYDLKQVIGEALFRFQQGAIYRAREFNADPHPGNYRFHADGRITLLDFGLAKRWTQQEIDSLWPLIGPLLAGDAEGAVEQMVTAGFLAPDHGLDPQHVWEYVSTPYEPFLVDEFEFSREFTRDALGRIADISGPYADVINSLTLPPSFILLDRVVWGVAAILGRLGARNRWRAILAEYREDAAPVTRLGALEAEWVEARPLSKRPDQI
jgi:predicted unusual protein kinase regulating ubiquinone biosynthesis (AarF/ABC1/UbiB family)